MLQYSNFNDSYICSIFIRNSELVLFYPLEQIYSVVGMEINKSVINYETRIYAIEILLKYFMGSPYQKNI